MRSSTFRGHYESAWHAMEACMYAWKWFHAVAWTAVLLKRKCPLTQLAGKSFVMSVTCRSLDSPHFGTWGSWNPQVQASTRCNLQGRWYSCSMLPANCFQGGEQGESSARGFNHLRRVSRTDAAAEKTWAVLFTKYDKFISLIFRLGKVEMRISSWLNYLGVWSDGKLSFSEHSVW